MSRPNGNGGAHLADEDVLAASEVQAGLSSLGGADEIDIQVSTAKRYPRSVALFIKRATEMVTLSAEVAQACVYALPRKENGKAKTIEGPSARFAEVMANAWTNIRAEGKTLGNDATFVTSRGTAWDVENNVAIAFEVQRRITTREGKTYNNDMISVTGNAGASVALRNAILKVIPAAFWRPIYMECRKIIAGDARTLASRREEMLKAFMVMGVTTDRLLASIDLFGIEDVTLDHLVTLRGIYNALKEGETTIEEAFPEGGGHGAPTASPRRSQQPTPPSAAVEPSATTPPQGAPAANVGMIEDVAQVAEGAWMIRLNTGFRAGTRESFLATTAREHREKKTLVELHVNPPKDPKYAPSLTGITIVEA
jgi:hypothetical protein